MKRIRWTVAASEDLEAIVRHIRKENFEAARNVAEQVFQSLEKLLTFPNLGRPGNKVGTRELPLPPYLLVYRVSKEYIEPLRIWHGARHRR